MSQLANALKFCALVPVAMAVVLFAAQFAFPEASAKSAALNQTMRLAELELMFGAASMWLMSLVMSSPSND